MSLPTPGLPTVPSSVTELSMLSADHAPFSLVCVLAGENLSPGAYAACLTLLVVLNPHQEVPFSSY